MKFTYNGKGNMKFTYNGKGNMKFTYNGKEYRISFRFYDNRMTSCTIAERFADNKNKPALVGRTLRNPKDAYDKEIARKMALTDALQLEPRPFRTAAWTAYNNRKVPSLTIERSDRPHPSHKYFQLVGRVSREVK